MREAIILVKKGNPKNIKGMADLLKPGIGIVVNDGAGVSNTSGTAVWEDSVGRMKNVEKLQAFRSNIHVFAQIVDQRVRRLLMVKILMHGLHGSIGP